MRPALFLAALMVMAAPVAPQAAPAAPQAANTSRTLQLANYLDWETVADPQMSPDGGSILYTRRWVNRTTDRWESSLWIMDADGNRNRQLIEGSGARWSPDGTRIVYTAGGDEGEGAQIFVRWMDAEGAVTQVTRVDESPSGPVWSPDGNSIAFVMTVPANEGWTVRLPGRPDGARWTAEPKVVTRLSYRRDRQGYIDDGFRHIFVVPATGGTPRQVTSGNFNHGSPAWTPDGRELLFSGNRNDGWEHQWRESDIYAVNVASGAVRQLTTRSGPDGNPVVSPDGRLVAYTGYDLTDDTYITQRLYLMNADGSNSREITGGLDRSPEEITWTADSRGLYFTADDRGSSHLYFSNLTAAPRRLTEGTMLFSLAGIVGTTAIGTRTSFHQPGDVIRLDLRRPTQLTQLTDVNADVLDGVRLGEVEEIWYTSVDDYRIQGWIVKPPDFNPSRRYPMMLVIHGGPHAMYGVGFNFGWQEHAAQGYVVLYTNPRGSTGYGSAFGNAIKNAYPGKDYNDLMAGVDSLIGRGYVDDQNMFVYGCSGGGVLTSWIVGQTNRFAAASANCPVTNWLSFVGTTDGATWYRNFASLPWEDPTEHLARSPLMHVGNVSTPTMLMTGERDLRTPMPQTEEYYMALRYRGVPTAMIRFRDEWHGTSSRPSNFLRTQLYLRGWFERHSRGRSATD
ncbi:MAG: S9 family peptidase [Gemmatimonadales bacterium]